jgi:hypothetical protein
MACYGYILCYCLSVSEIHRNNPVGLAAVPNAPVVLLGYGIDAAAAEGVIVNHTVSELAYVETGAIVVRSMRLISA